MAQGCEIQSNQEDHWPPVSPKSPERYQQTSNTKKSTFLWYLLIISYLIMTSYCFYLPHTFRPIPGDIDSASGKGKPTIQLFCINGSELWGDCSQSELRGWNFCRIWIPRKMLTTLRHFTPPSDLTFEGDTLFSFTFSVSLRGSCGKPGLPNRGNIRWQITINHPFVYSGSWMNWDGLRWVYFGVGWWIISRVWSES